MKNVKTNSIKALQQQFNLQTISNETKKDIKGGGFASSPLGFNISNGFFDIFTE